MAVRFGARVKALSLKDTSVTALDVDGTEVPLSPQDTVVLAVPPWVAETLVTDIKVPPAGEPIVNVHYRLPAPAVPPGGVRLVGVIGGLSQWVFAHGDLASVTISAAAGCVDHSAEDIARTCWREVALALELGEAPAAPSRVVKERRATFAQTPETLALRPSAKTRWANLLLAGDWTATGLPATIEGALRSGFKAATLASQRQRHG